MVKNAQKCYIPDISISIANATITIITHIYYIIITLSLQCIYQEIYQQMPYSDYPILGVEISRARKRFQHPLLTSKLGTMTQRSNHYLFQSPQDTGIEQWEEKMVSFI